MRWPYYIQYKWENYHNHGKMPILQPLKKGPKTHSSNYRPVSLTSIVVKTMEKLIRDTPVQHMLTNNLFSDNQFGFLPSRSTTLQMIIVLDELTKMLDGGGEVDVIYMDFMKAFQIS